MGGSGEWGLVCGADSVLEQKWEAGWRDWFARQRKEEVMDPALDVLAVILEQFWLTRNLWEAQHGSQTCTLEAG